MYTIVHPDPKPEKRIKDSDLLRELHLEWKECALCRSIGETREGVPNPEGLRWIGLSLHHIVKHPKDDVRGNLVMLCGHGTAGCHGLIEAHDPDTLKDLGRYILTTRGDTIAHLYERLGATAARAFLSRNLLVDS
jgi:HNH endonuclease.